MRYDELNQNYQQNVVDSVQQAFPVEGRKRRLVAKKVWVDDHKSKADFEGQKKARLLDQTWSVPVRAELELHDKNTGKVVSKKTVTVARIPKPTNFHGFIVKGKEYHLTNQFLLKPGVYNKVKADGSLASEYHLQGKAFDIRFDPKTRKFYLKAGGAKPDLYPVLRALGVSDDQLEKEWGKEILEANKKYRKSSLQTFVKNWTGRKVSNDSEAAALLEERLKNSQLSPEVTKITIGEEHPMVTPQTMLKSTQELLRLSRGERKPDNSESLVFKRLRTAGTIVGDAVKEHHRVVRRKVLNNIDRTTDLEKIVPTSAFEAPIINVISNSSLSTYGDQVNPLESLTNASKTTVMGEGGLKSTHSISDQMKLVDPSHLGFLDPIHTPEDSKAGVTLTLSEATKFGKEQPQAVFWDIKKKKFVRLEPKDLVGKKIVYPDQVKYDSSKGAVVPVSKKVDYHDPLEGPGASKIDWSKADLSLIDPVQVYSQTTNLVPMLRNVAAVRASMATRQVTQAVPLKEREAPLVQVKSTVANTTNEKLYGKTLAVDSPTDGMVTKIAGDHIMIRPNGSRKAVKVPLAKNMPLNGDKSMLDSEPLVKVGDKVKKGQVIADTNFTKNGELALGKNMTVAYMPFKGLNFEDGVVVSESAAKKLTSVHLHKKSLDVGKEGKLNKKGFQAHYGNLLPKENADKLDDEGVIKPGTVIQPGEILIAGLRKAQPTTEQEMLKKLSRSLVKPYSNAAVVWDKDYPGVVTDVIKKNGQVRVLVKTEQPLVKADKIVGRFANKGIVTAVIPDGEMPKTKDGKPVDVIMNPMGVPGRINLGQVFETAASKIAEKTGKPYIVSSFDPDINSTIDKIQQDLKKHGVKDTEPLYDPKTGKKLGEVQVGKQYIYKLKHMVETKATARAGGAGYAYDQDRIPKGGGKSGAKSVGNLGVYGMLSHGLYKNLQEMHTWKMDMTQADQLWRAIQQGLPPPAPRPTFAYDKFVSLLNAAGVDVNKDGNTLVLSPMIDKQVLKISSGEIKDPGRMVLAKDPTKPEKGGLFDPKVTGGLGGRSWCFHESTKVLTQEYGYIPISKIVTQKLDVHVWSYDIKSGSFGWQKVVNYWKRVRDEEHEPLLRVELEHPQLIVPFLRHRGKKGSGIGVVHCTAGHEFVTRRGKVKVSDLQPDDEVAVPTIKMNKIQRQLLLGTLLGDSWKGPNGQISGSHGSKQHQYFQFKTKILGSFISKTSRQDKKVEGKFKARTVYHYSTIACPETREIIDLLYRGDSKRHLTREYLDLFDEFSVAVWYFDEGSLGRKGNKLFAVISMNRYTEEEVELAAEWFRERWGLHVTKGSASRKGQFILRFSPNSTLDLLRMTAPYAVECMQYKVNPDYRPGHCKNCGAPIPPVYSYCDSCILQDVAKYKSKWRYRNAEDALVDESTVRKRFGSWSLAKKMAASGYLPDSVYAVDKFEDLHQLAGSAVEKVLEEAQQVEVSVGYSRVKVSLSSKGFARKKTVYNLGVENTHTYLAGAFVVGNSHIPLAEPMPNPVFEKPIKAMLDITNTQFDVLVAGKAGVDAQGKFVADPKQAKYVGPEAIKHALSKINVDAEIKELEKQLPGLRKDQLDKAHKKLKYLRTLKKLNVSPAEAYTRKYLPVLPPQFRPLSVDQNGAIVRDGLNELYKGVGLINKQLKDLKGKLPDKELQDLRKDNYDALKAYSGLGTHPELQYKGVLGIISGKGPEGKKMVGQPKTGYFQKKLIGARQDMSMYSTITPNPQLSLDEVGLPEALAMKLYTPFVVRKITQTHQVSPLQAREMIKKNDDTARAALRSVADERPVLLKRDPVLHRYGIMGFKPKIVGGKTIQIHPLVTGGYGADFDGNCVIGSSKIVLTMGVSDAKLLLDRMVKKGDLDMLTAKEKLMLLETLTDEDIAVLEVPIKDMPIDTSIEPLHDKNGNPVYAVLGNYKVLSYDHETGKSKFCSIAGLTVEENCPTVKVETDRHQVTVSDNESLCVYNHQTGGVEKVTPGDNVGALVPVVKKLPEYGSLYNWDIGWLVGSFVSDGWLIHNNGVGYTKVSVEHRQKFAQLLLDLEPNLKIHTYSAEHEAESNAGVGGLSVKIHAFGIEKHIGLFDGCYTDDMPSSRDASDRAALYKQLPEIVEFFSEEALWGLFSGLIDGDGSISRNKKGKFVVQYHTSSKQLVEDLIRLGATLGIRTSVTSYGPKKGRVQTHTAWVINFSVVDVAAVAASGKIKLLTKRANDVLAQLVEAYRDGMKDDHDIVPITDSLISVFASSKSELDSKTKRSLATIKSKSKPHYALSRMLATRIIRVYDQLPSHDRPEGYQEWKQLCESDVSWERIKKVELAGKQRVYDLVIPETKVFAVNNGMVVWDTMSAYVPISQEAVQEAYKAMPSRNLFSVASGQLMNVPKMEMTTGLFLASKPGKLVRKSYASAKEAQEAVSRGEIGYNDRVMIGGKRTTPAEAKLAEALPAKLRKKYVGKLLDKKTQQQMFADLAKEDPTRYSDTLNSITSLANDYMYQQGFSLGLKDYAPDKKIRDKYFKAADLAASKIKDPTKKVEVYDIAMSKAYKELVRNKVAKPDNLFLLTLSGTKPGPDQYRQIALAPGLVMNPDGTINPRPIKKSYSEGLSMADYWTATSGARKGIITKVQSVTEPGALTKQMMNAVLDQVVVDSDCDSDFGISEDTTSKSVLNRVLAKPVKMGKKTIPAGTVITPEVASRLRSNRIKKVVVHSPLRCVHGNDGVCSKCYGLDVTGKEIEPGTNIGVIAAHSLGERTTQLALKGFHGGGVLPIGGTQGNKQLTDQFTRLNQLLTVPKVVPDAAPLARKDGVVEDIRPDPAGGWRVKVGSEDHYVPQKLGKPALVNKGKIQPLRVGMRVQKGDQLAPGVINPHELLELKGVEPVQRYLTDELYKIYEPHGIDKRHVEVVVGAITNIGKVEDPGDVPGFVRGDPIKLSTAAYLNKKVDGKKMKVQPHLKGVVVAPFDLTQDWMALLNHQRLQDTISEGAAQGWVSDLSGSHPIPSLVLGQNIGERYRKK